MILFYGEKEGKYKGFSNFSDHPFQLDGYYWKSVEHYFQAQKYIGTDKFEYIRNLPTPKDAAYEGRKFNLRKDWKIVRYEIMLKAVRRKFLSHPSLLEILLNTGDEEIVENNPKDEIWANGKNGDGQNLFGKVLMELRKEINSVVMLESEKSLRDLPISDLIERIEIIKKLREVPVAMFEHLRHFQPQVGCFNRCSFCSQSAGSSIWYLNMNGLRNVFSALKTVAIEHANNYKLDDGTDYILNKLLVDEEGKILNINDMPQNGLLGYARHSHRPGVLFCYLDNDISTYPYFYEYLKYAKEDLGVKIRISTVGYSRRNETIQQMHEKINRDLLESVAGVRLSLTSYTYGWTLGGQRKGVTSREEMMNDIKNYLKTYKPMIDYLGPGQRTAGVEIRFSPLICSKLPFFEGDYDSRHVISVGPYLLVAKKEKVMNISTISVNQERKMIINGEGQVYKMYKHDEFYFKSTLEFDKYINQSELNKIKCVTEVLLYKMQNEDGIYYVSNPEMSNTGYFAKHFYPKTQQRPYSGYIDTERYFLNELLTYKRKKGIKKRRGTFEKAVWSDAENVLSELRQTAYGSTNDVKEYILNEILPIVEAYLFALKNANYPPSYFFLSTFTIDTGSICNLGQAYFEFRDLVSRPNMPLTPQHEKSYGKNSSLSNEGEVWRLSVIPTVENENSISKKATGLRNPVTHSPHLLVERENLEKRSVAGPEGIADSRFTIPLKDVSSMNTREGEENYFLMGQKEKV